MAELDYDVLYSSYDELYRGEQFAKYSAALSSIGNIRGLILDAGCGTGLFYEYLRRSMVDNRFEYFGVDKSLNMLRRARARIDEQAHLMAACVELMPFRSDIFSYIFSFTVFHEVDIDKALTEIRRIGVCGAYVVISLLKKVEAGKVLDKCREVGVELSGVVEDDDLKDLIFVFRCR